MIIYKCEYCNKSFDRKQNLTRHYERKNKCYDINKFRVVEMKHNNATPNDTTTQKDTQTDTQNDTTTQKDTQNDTQNDTTTQKVTQTDTQIDTPNDTTNQNDTTTQSNRLTRLEEKSQDFSSHIHKSSLTNSCLYQKDTQIDTQNDTPNDTTTQYVTTTQKDTQTDTTTQKDTQTDTQNDTTTQKDTQTDTQNDTTTQKDTQKDTQIQPVSDLIIANNKPIKMSELHDSIKYLTKLSNNGKNKSSKIIKFSKTERDRKILRRLKPTKNITETKRIYRKSIKLKKNI